MSPLIRLNPLTPPSVDELILSIIEGSTEVGNDGTAVRLSSLQGSIVVLLVLGIDCGTCKRLAGELSHLHREYAPEVSFLGVCVQRGCQEKLKEFNDAAAAAFPLAHCPSRELCSALRIPKATWLFFPTMIFLDREQRVRGLFVGGDTFFNDAIRNTREVIERLELETMQLQACSGVSA